MVAWHLILAFRYNEGILDSAQERMLCLDEINNKPFIQSKSLEPMIHDNPYLQESTNSKTSPNFKPINA